LKITNNIITDTFSSLINPNYPIKTSITGLTGITNQMLSLAPQISEVISSADEFISNNVIVGHNVNFDIDFMYDNFSYILKKPLKNNFIDTMYISKMLYPEMSHHSLIDLINYLNIESDEHHRALSDCIYTYKCLLKMQTNPTEHIAIENFNQFSHTKTHSYKDLSIKNISTNKTEFNEKHPLFNKICVFTGTLEKFTRQEAAQAVVDLGGQCKDGLTKQTNFLILGNEDKKSNKLKKAEEYKLKGYDIEIISENVFLDMINK
jgi:DNA polymerase-3 subunit epsilon